MLKLFENSPMKELAYLISGEIILVVMAFLLYRNIRTTEQTADELEAELPQPGTHLHKKWKYFIGSIVLSAVLLIVIIKFMINML